MLKLNKFKSLIVLSILFSSLCLSFLMGQSANAKTIGVVQPTNTVATCSVIMGSIPQPTPNVNCFSKVQPAIDASSAGDIIKVGPGTFNERLIISKRIILQGSSGFTSIINAGGNSGIPSESTPITIKGNSAGAIIRSLVIKNAAFGKAGVYLERTTNVTVTNNKIMDNFYGIKTVAANGNTISNNVFTNTAQYGGWYAILIQNTEYMTGGSKTQGSTNNTISGNTIDQVADGIFVGENCDSNRVLSNIVASTKGMALNVWGSDNNTIQSNTLKNSKIGVTLYGSNSNNLNSNKILNNAQAFQFDAMWGTTPSINNVITGNNIVGNTVNVKQGTGNGSTLVNMTNNWWGTTNRDEIVAKFKVNTLESILFDPYSDIEFYL